MPLTLDDKALHSGVDALIRAIFAGAEHGLEAGASVPEQMMQSSPAHGDQSGASHASYDVALIGGARTGSSEASAAYGVASSHLSGFTGHAGQALSQDSGIVLGPNDRGLIYRSFTDYQHKLEQSPKAVIGPTVAQTGALMTQYAADGIKGELT